MQKKKILLILMLAGVVALFIGLDMDRFLSLERIKLHRIALVAFYSEHRLITAVAFILLYIVQTALALPGALLLSITAGAVFGVLPGTLFAITGATLGAVIAFLATRYLLHGWVLEKIGSRWDQLSKDLEKNGMHYLLFLRFVPVFPFFLVNFAAGLTRLPLRTFFLGTLVGILPGAFVYVNAGASLASIETLSGIVSPRVFGSFVLLGVFAVAPVFYQKMRYASKKRRQVNA